MQKEYRSCEATQLDKDRMKNMTRKRTRNVALIDIGSSKAKFVVASVRNGQKEKTLHRESRLINIGAGLNTTHPVVSSEAIAMLTQVLRDYASIMRSYAVSAARVIGTDALRQARNIVQVQALVQQEAGARLEILSHQEEAQLFFSVVSSRFPGRIAVVDVGGGSVQLSIGSRNNLEQSYLLRTGTVTMQRTYIHSTNPSSDELDRVWQHVRDQIRQLSLMPTGVDKLVYGSTNILSFFQEAGIGTNTVRNIPEHPLQADVNELINLYYEIVRYPYDARSRFFPSDPYFMHGADLSLINVICLCQALGVREVIPTNLNLSEALLVGLA